MQDENSNAIAIRKRFEKLLGKKTSKDEIAHVIADLVPAGFSSAKRWLNKGFPAHVVRTLDLLERVPRAELPNWAIYILLVSSQKTALGRKNSSE